MACSSRKRLRDLSKYLAKNGETVPLKSRLVNSAWLEFKKESQGEKIEEHEAGDEQKYPDVRFVVTGLQKGCWKMVPPGSKYRQSCELISSQFFY